MSTLPVPGTGALDSLTSRMRRENYGYATAPQPHETCNRCNAQFDPVNVYHVCADKILDELRATGKL